MRYAVIVKTEKRLDTALFFCQACQAKGHKVLRVFLMGSAVLIANRLRVSAPDTFDMTAAWEQFAQSSDLIIQVCSTSAAKYGILSAEQEHYFGKSDYIMSPHFEANGFVECFTSCHDADRTIML